VIPENGDALTGGERQASRDDGGCNVIPVDVAI
jgi:hypothetical protein